MKEEKSIVDTKQKFKHPIAIEGIQFSGPIPPPAILQEYNNINPGCADRIIKYAEDEAEHRRKVEILTLKTETLEIRLGQIFGFLIGITTILSGTYAAINGSQIAGSLIGTGGVIGLVTAFITGRSSKR
ncbi:conserved hypothetical protein, membrane [Candidatus Magnetomorum sp. HK-1]|nr:conserved hypothetical protein, membrane [Candidatus Magnetomorum sp. HK-1]